MFAVLHRALERRSRVGQREDGVDRGPQCAAVDQPRELDELRSVRGDNEVRGAVRFLGNRDEAFAVRSGSGSPYELNPTQLMRATLLSSGGITKRLDRLAEAGLVERRPDPNDRRGTLVKLTRRGRGVIDKLIAVHIANEERLLQLLKPAERRVLDDALRRLLATLEPNGEA